MTGLRQQLLRAVASQLGRPHGLLSPVVARALNRGNANAIADAVDAADIHSGAVVADVGFGGGVGLRLLLDRVGEGGTVYGFDVADAMLRRARRKFGDDRRLRLEHGSLTALPLDDAALDAVITLNTVYFVDLEAACAELARVVRPRGRIVVGIGDPDAMRRTPVTDFGFTLRPVEAIAAALAGCGLAVEHRRIEERPMPRHLFTARRAA